MIKLENLSQENGKKISRSVEPSYTETLINMWVSYLMIGLMARESQHLQTEISTRETIKMVRGTGLASSHGMMGSNMRAAGRRIIDME